MPISNENRKALLEVAELTASTLVDLFDITAKVLMEGISQTKSSPAVGLQHTGLFADLLHGGAYRRRIEDLPYYSKKVQDQLLRLAFGPGEIELPDGRKIAIPAQAKPEQQELIINSAEPHVFPKLLSDQQYYLQKEWASLFQTSALVTQTVTTPLTTLVEAGLGERGIAGLLSATRPKVVP